MLIPTAKALPLYKILLLHSELGHPEHLFLLQKQQISVQKTFQFISSINGVSQTYKKAKIFFFI